MRWRDADGVPANRPQDRLAQVPVSAGRLRVEGAVVRGGSVLRYG